jgi:hypothetical protein
MICCSGCAQRAPVIEPGSPGASARREYQRRRAQREAPARSKLGGLGVVVSRVIAEPESTIAWRRGADGEARVAARLHKHLDGSGVRLLHDRRVSGHGRANIDHLAVGPAGVTVIDTKNVKGGVRVERVGGLLSPRRQVLVINGRDRTSLVDGVERQVEVVGEALRELALAPIRVCGALCFADGEGLPLLAQLSVRGIVIEAPRHVAKLARRPGPLTPALIESIWEYLARRFPPA